MPRGMIGVAALWAAVALGAVVALVCVLVWLSWPTSPRHRRALPRDPAQPRVGRNRLAMVALVVVAGGVAASWPDRSAGTIETPNSVVSAARSSATRPIDADVHARAVGARCPTGSDGRRSTGPLSGLVVECLTASAVVDFGEVLTGRTTLVNLWASWCASCREEMPVLSAYAAQSSVGSVLGVDVQDTADAARQLIEDLHVTYPSVFDGDGAVQRALHGPPLLPMSYVVYPDGSVHRVTIPLVFRTTEEVATAIARA
jgi:thiol-disulfide isomerase/thioredoxin